MSRELGLDFETLCMLPTEIYRAPVLKDFLVF